MGFVVFMRPEAGRSGALCFTCSVRRSSSCSSAGYTPRWSTSELFPLPGMSAVRVLTSRRFLRQVAPSLPASMRRHYSLDVPAALLRTQGYLGGRWVSAASEFPVLDPATGQELTQVSDCGPAEAKQAVDAAYEAFQSWKQTTTKGSWQLFADDVVLLVSEAEGGF
ncbi:hypothetical protein XENOCAPTIV_011450 [Xenoophorus captivus]|uniref:Aldehyde dehydrogenase domain-containing protein n=1 Tax=Xenoophorus captivus TaxID=1517983 RepID=A0ABV0Q9D8_9TELE